MNSGVSLIKREWLEHKTGFGWAPIGVLATVIVITLLLLTVARAASGTITISSDSSSGSSVEEFVFQRQFLSMLDYGDSSDEEISNAIDEWRSVVAVPFQLVYFLVAVFALLGALHEDRRDRTVLFWKSMPVSDSETVLSKLVHIVWVAPVVTIAAIIAAQIFLLLVGSIAMDGGFWRLWANSGLIMELIELTVGFLIQGLWALPIYGWLLLVSVTVNRVPFLVAILVPVVPITLEPVIFSTSILYTGITNHLKFAALHSPELGDGTHLGDQLGLLVAADMWIGIAIGAAFIAGTIYMRRRNNEI